MHLAVLSLLKCGQSWASPSPSLLQCAARRRRIVVDRRAPLLPAWRQNGSLRNRPGSLIETSRPSSREVCPWTAVKGDTLTCSSPTSGESSPSAIHPIIPSLSRRRIHEPQIPLALSPRRTCCHRAHCFTLTAPAWPVIGAAQHHTCSTPQQHCTDHLLARDGTSTAACLLPLLPLAHSPTYHPTCLGIVFCFPKLVDVAPSRPKHPNYPNDQSKQPSSNRRLPLDLFARATRNF